MSNNGHAVIERAKIIKLMQDPTNVRRHSDRNVDAIKTSLHVKRR